ncbi:RidA family protein [Swaminathania salitolerans]|uniref:RidA family protein n=1 Tax=Swaminathania salitolerans TaxID=182838 RepID=UPI001649AAD8|nr:RidA family protein [Swaminathania salitolerans]
MSSAAKTPPRRFHAGAARLVPEQERARPSRWQTLASASRMSVRLTIYVRDYQPAQLPTIRSIRNRCVDPDRPPASAPIGVAGLFHPDIPVEIDAIAPSRDSPGSRRAMLYVRSKSRDTTPHGFVQDRVGGNDAGRAGRPDDRTTGRPDDRTTGRVADPLAEYNRDFGPSWPAATSPMMPLM